MSTATTTEGPERTAERVWHDVFLPQDVQHVRRLARDSVARHLAPVAREIAQREESRDAFPWAAFRGLASDGLFVVPFAQPHGAGLEHPILATCLVTEEIAYESSSMAGVYDGQYILNAQALSFAQHLNRAHRRRSATTPPRERSSRVRTRSDARTRLSTQMLAVLLCADCRDRRLPIGPPP
jgi:alkylation response protein AidB-like acyl-CoA dehydrogenase